MKYIKLEDDDEIGSPMYIFWGESLAFEHYLMLRSRSFLDSVIFLETGIQDNILDWCLSQSFWHWKVYKSKTSRLYKYL